ncbi:MAG TPA: (deoxy)nucleoside triphosphate pyrophosphohydrolase [Candidatus Kryptonia bacterium]|nr:(deoxy)nucleoside triphosphate pyrophosphohydrolase [Candidatus Kryptonia bacterium]
MIQVAAAIIVRGGEVLVCQRPATGPHPLKWEFPGGKCEAGETIEACLQRELREELGIDADIGRELWRTQHEYPGRPPFGLRFLRVTAYRGALQPHAFAALRWITVEQMHTLDFLEGDRDFIRRLERGEISLTS